MAASFSHCTTQAHLDELEGGGQVTLVELVGHIEANGTKLAPFLHDGVQEAGGEEKLAPLKPAAVRRIGKVMGGWLK